ncbi:hypothetical protein [Jiulongibacter sediminis]|uniref:hypothetical protein n=1 Tax=Jiulongibacter sediminis TaxID=1605367 RepID=UPI0026EEF0EC|nr:hypothetical protein [Jiulongibacter sediminis]
MSKVLLFLFSLLLSLYSCRGITCEEYFELINEDEFNIVIEEVGHSRLDIKGLNPETGLPESFKSQNYLWIGDIQNRIELGDTIRKNASSMKIELFKRDTVIACEYECIDLAN